MKTIQLKISDKVYEKFLWLLSKFSSEEIEIINKDEVFITTKKHLQNELSNIDKGLNSNFSEADLKKLQKGIEIILNKSESFKFLNEEEDIYGESDLIEKY